MSLTFPDTYDFFFRRNLGLFFLSQVKFSSPMGNSLVPYTFAVDADGRYFLFIEKVGYPNGKWRETFMFSNVG